MIQTAFHDVFNSGSIVFQVSGNKKPVIHVPYHYPLPYQKCQLRLAKQSFTKFLLSQLRTFNPPTMDVKISLIFLLLGTTQSQSAWINCQYLNYEFYGYTCLLSIDNPDGLNTFTDITGDHLFGLSDVDVLYVTTSIANTFNFPSIVCEKFTSLKWMYFASAGLDRLDDYSFRNCQNLIELGFYKNNLTQIHENSFAFNLQLDRLSISDSRLNWLPENVFNSLKNLKELTLVRTDIEDLPTGLLSPLTNLNSLWIYASRLRTIRAASFGFLPNLRSVMLGSNQISAIDEAFVDNTGVSFLDLYGNVCVNNQVSDNSEGRQVMRQMLRMCFNNFDSQCE